MKRLFFIILILLLASQSWAAAKFNAMTGATDFIEIVDDATDITIACSTGEILKKGASDWECATDSTAAGGQAVILDLADDATNESTDLGEIAVTNDTDSVWSEPSADKLLFNGANLLYESELDTFAEIQSQIADKTLVNTADGATWTGTHDFGGATLEVPNTVVGSLPAATLGRLAIVTDGASDSDCTTGGGSTVVSCMANGSTWEPTGDSGTGGGGTPGGSDGQVQYNNSGAFGGENELFYDDVNNRLGVGTSTPAYTLDVTGAGQFTGALIVGSTLGVTEQVTMTKGVIVNNGRDTTTSGDFLVQGAGITDLIFADASANDVIFDGDVVLTQGTSCADTTEGSICWDTDDDTLNVGNGATVTTIGGGGSGDITDVFNCSTGDCSAIVMGASDSLDAGAGVLEIPNGAAPTVDATGEIAFDTTDNQLKIYDGSAVAVIPTVYYESKTIENLAAADDDLEIFMANDAITIVSIGVHCSGTCTTAASISLEDRAGNAMTHTAPTASTGTSNTTYQAVTGGNSLVAGEALRFDVDNAVSPETDTYTISFGYTVDAQ